MKRKKKVGAGGCALRARKYALERGGGICLDDAGLAVSPLGRRIPDTQLVGALLQRIGDALNLDDRPGMDAVATNVFAAYRQQSRA